MTNRITAEELIGLSQAVETIAKHADLIQLQHEEKLIAIKGDIYQIFREMFANTSEQAWKLWEKDLEDTIRKGREDIAKVGAERRA